MADKGYDTFITEPDAEAEMHCKVCGAVCEVERSLHEATGWMEAMGRRGHWHDRFTCPHSAQDWHEQALELIHAIEETPSKRLAALMQLDLEDILSANGRL